MKLILIMVVTETKIKLHQLGLSTLTYTPAPMFFLNDVLDRPENERAYMILPVGYPSEDYKTPDIDKKSIEKYLIKF